MTRLDKHGRKALDLNVTSHEKAHYLLILMNIGFAAIILSAIIILTLMAIDSTYIFGEEYISRIQTGEHAFIFNITLIATALIVIITMPALLEGVIDIADNDESKTIFKMFVSMLFYTIAFLIPIALFQYENDNQRLVIFGWTTPNLHGFFAIKFFINIIYIVYLILLIYCFNAINEEADRENLLRIGQVIIVFNSIALFLADTWAEFSLYIYASILISFAAYFVMVIVKSDVNVSISKFSFQTKLFMILLFLDIIIIAYFDSQDFFDLFALSIDGKQRNYFATFEVVLFINIVIIAGYFYFKEILEGKELLKKYHK